MFIAIELMKKRLFNDNLRNLHRNQNKTKIKGECSDVIIHFDFEVNNTFVEVDRYIQILEIKINNKI